ncbi:MAG: hypothetical protein VCC04_05820, partial [Myxococcota bacterium]
MSESHNKKGGWLERPGSVDKVVRAVIGVCLFVVLLDFFYDKHGHYSWEELPGFYAFFGFISCVLLVVAAKGLRKLLMRDEDYYD